MRAEWPHAMTNTHKLQHVPVKHIVIREALSVEEVSEELPQVRVIRLVVEAQRATEVQVGGKLSCDNRENTFQLMSAAVLESGWLTQKKASLGELQTHKGSLCKAPQSGWTFSSH